MAHYDFATSQDGTKIYYHIINAKAKQDIILCDGIGCSGYAWHYLLEYFKRDFRFIHWHLRGHGNSAAPAKKDALTMDHIEHDLKAVIAATHSKSPLLFGHSMGVQVALHYCLQNPEQAKGLVLLCGSYGNLLETFHDAEWMNLLFPYLRYSVHRYPALFQLLWNFSVPMDVIRKIAMTFEVNGDFVSDADFIPYFEDLADVNLELFLGMLKNANEHTNEHLLHRLRLPVLIVSGQVDTFTPSWVSRKMHRLICSSEYLEVRGGSHIAPIEFHELVNLRVEKFLHEHDFYQ